MNYQFCAGEKEIYNTYWNVFSSFGYEEAIFDEISDDGVETVRLLGENGVTECKTVILRGNNEKGCAEAVAVGIEAALAVGFPDFKVKVRCRNEKIEDLLYLYSLDEYTDFEEGDFSFEGKSGETVIFKGCIENGAIVCTYDLKAGCKAMGSYKYEASKTVVFAEKDADGIAYEISYTLRLSGCLVVMYIGCGNIEDCEKESVKTGVSDIIRVFSDGKIQIKNLADNEITETDYETFVGYYDEDEHEHHDCGCGHEHHGHDCDCGNH